MAPSRVFEIDDPQFEVGDRMVLRTDGVTEGTNPSGCVLGGDSLREHLLRHRGRSAEEPVEADALDQQARDERSDDATVVALAMEHRESLASSAAARSTW